MDDARKEGRRRPEIQRYRPPGMGPKNQDKKPPISADPPGEPVKSHAWTFTMTKAPEDPPKSILSDNNASPKDSRQNKKPDKEVYIPRARTVEPDPTPVATLPQQRNRGKRDRKPPREENAFPRRDTRQDNRERFDVRSHSRNQSSPLPRQAREHNGQPPGRQPRNSSERDRDVRGKPPAHIQVQEHKIETLVFEAPVVKPQPPPAHITPPVSRQSAPRELIHDNVLDNGNRNRNRRPGDVTREDTGNRRGRSKRGNARSDFRHEPNLPPRLQKKLQEKSGQPNQVQPTPSTSTESNVHRGLIRLPQETISDITEPDLHDPFGQPNFPKAIKIESWADAMDRRPIAVPQKQLFDPYSRTSKPCVAIRPIPQQRPDDIHRRTPPRARTPQQNQFPVSPTATLHFPESFDRRSPVHDMRRSKIAIVEKNWQEVKQLELDLEAILSRGYDSSDRRMNECRWKMAHRYENIILSDPRFCAEVNVELFLWKNVYYQIIERLRKGIEENPDNQNAKEDLHKIIEEGSVFFDTLIDKLQDAYSFSVDKFIEHEYDPDEGTYQRRKLVAVCAHKLFICLGDLARYKELAAGTTIKKARSYYQKAQQLAPKDGKPYNQLALLAMYGNRKLDAVYYYMRSLAASNPFLTARENLIAIFDEVRKKYEAAEKKRLEDKMSALSLKRKQRQQDAQFTVMTDERVEIWIRPDGTSSKHSSAPDDDAAEEELDILTDVNLNKRFVLSFLHVHGKLFSKVGMEDFARTVNQMLLEFRCLLKRSPTPVGSQRLLQLMAINMFSIQHTSLKNPTYGNEGCRSLLQNQAIQVTFAMISLIMEKAISSLREHFASSYGNLISDDCGEFLPAITIWTTWMSCQRQLWAPAPPAPDFHTGCTDDIWSLFADFLTLLSDTNARAVKLLPNKFEGCEAVVLPEDTMLAGFTPLLGAPQTQNWCQPPYDKEKARACYRITRIQFFGDYLCGIPEPYLGFDVERRRFRSLVAPVAAGGAPESRDEISDEVEERSAGASGLEMSGALEDAAEALAPRVEPGAGGARDTQEGDDDELEDDEDDCPSSEEANEINELRRRKKSLESQQRKQELRQQHHNAVLEQSRRPTRMVVHPRFLVADTNCFIDHLDKLDILISSGFYEILVPLVVINEIKGLQSRLAETRSSPVPTSGPATASDATHHQRVGQAALLAMDFLEQAFAKRRALKAITSKGSLLDSLSFTSESCTTLAQGTTNDDLILEACRQLIRERPAVQKGSALGNEKEEEGSNNVFRETVLLTEDRILRVKALCHNVPVKSLPVFMRWAHLP